MANDEQRKLILFQMYDGIKNEDIWLEEQQAMFVHIGDKDKVEAIAKQRQVNFKGRGHIVKRLRDLGEKIEDKLIPETT